MSLDSALKVASNSGNEFDYKIRSALPVLAKAVADAEKDLSETRASLAELQASPYADHKACRATTSDLVERLQKIRRFVDEETRIKKQ